MLHSNKEHFLRKFGMKLSKRQKAKKFCNIDTIAAWKLHSDVLSLIFRAWHNRLNRWGAAGTLLSVVPWWEKWMRCLMLFFAFFLLLNFVPNLRREWSLSEWSMLIVAYREGLKTLTLNMHQWSTSFKNFFTLCQQKPLIQPEPCLKQWNVAANGSYCNISGTGPFIISYTLETM